MSVSTNALVAAKIASGPAIPEITFTDLESLEKFADKQVSAFHKSPTESQYILIQKIPRDVFEKIDETDHGLSSTRMHYDYKTGDLIAKLVPSVEHYALALHLAYFLLDAVNFRVGKHSYFLVGCATFRGPDSAKQEETGDSNPYQNVHFAATGQRWSWRLMFMRVWKGFGLMQSGG